MDANELRKLLIWADTAKSNREFWRRLCIAARAYDLRTSVNIWAIAVNVGGFTLDTAPEKSYNGSDAREKAPTGQRE
jgi:hypothetical protein